MTTICRSDDLTVSPLVGRCVWSQVPLSMSLLDFGMGSMLANFHMCGIMLLLRAVLNILVRNVRLTVCELFGEIIRSVG